MGLVIVPAIPQPAQYVASGYGAAVSFPANSVLGNLTFTEDIDTQAQFDGTTFTVQKAGVYKIICTGAPALARSIKITAKINAADDVNYAMGDSPASSGIPYTYVGVFNLSAGDTIIMRGYTTDVAAANVKCRLLIARL